MDRVLSRLNHPLLVIMFLQDAKVHLMGNKFEPESFADSIETLSTIQFDIWLSSMQRAA